MKPSHIKLAIKAAIKARRPLFITGSPGVGKSQVIKAVARELGIGLIDERISTMDPVDLRGLPAVQNGIVTWAQPGFLPREERDGANGLLLLDELTSAAPASQVAAYQLILDRCLGDYRLPDGWVVIAAGNKATDRAVVQKMSKALGNRFSHAEFEVDFDDFQNHALDAGFAPEVIAYLRFRPDALFDFDPADPSPAYASPRSWEIVSDYVKTDLPKEIEHGLIAGTVGEGRAAEFVGFLRIWRNLTDPAMILMAPDSAPVPNDPATLYATCGSLARMASPDNMERVVTYADRLPAEFSVLMVQDAAKITPGVQQTRAFIGWAAKNRDILI
jgi:hypothetical protein